MFGSCVLDLRFAVLSDRTIRSSSGDLAVGFSAPSVRKSGPVRTIG